jgi:hypothetical protein
MATEVHKFGINLIFAGQAINADLVGPMRDQITTRICYQVARREISCTVVYRPGAELTLAPHCVWCSAGVARPGHGLTMDGRLQAYYLDKQVMIDLAQHGQPASNAAPVADAVSTSTIPRPSPSAREGGPAGDTLGRLSTGRNLSRGGITMSDKATDYMAGDFGFSNTRLYGPKGSVVLQSLVATNGTQAVSQ